jgi:hypothetical protein
LVGNECQSAGAHVEPFTVMILASMFLMLLAFIIQQ